MMYAYYPVCVSGSDQGNEHMEAAAAAAVIK